MTQRTDVEGDITSEPGEMDTSPNTILSPGSCVHYLSCILSSSSITTENNETSASLEHTSDISEAAEDITIEDTIENTERPVQKMTRKRGLCLLSIIKTYIKQYKLNRFEEKGCR